ncbi:MAG: hypothetical protein PHQ59_05430 [Candidatus Daviesbacteria bacterium]|nr:hypothetical protein [Candidatus Daviesbacteria bacterium]
MATLTTKEVDIQAFQAAIFTSDADLISPVVIEEREGPYIIQTLPDFFAAMKRHPNWWSSYAGPAGIGQYSLITGKPAGVLARVDAHFRTPSDREIREDFQQFGEQVMGPAVSEVPRAQKDQYKNASVFQCFGESYYFSGPPRLNRTTFLSRVFPGMLPSDISGLVKDIESISEDGEMIVNQGYHLFHAVDGKISYLPFREVIDYDPIKLTEFGRMSMVWDKLLFYPSNTNKPVDFTPNILKL